MAPPSVEPPNLNSLTISTSDSLNPWEDDSSPTEQTQPAASTPAAASARSSSVWSAQAGPSPAQRLPPINTDEFDPFAPAKHRSQTPTLGSVVKPGSRLELLPPEDEDEQQPAQAGWSSPQQQLNWNQHPPPTPPKLSPTSLKKANPFGGAAKDGPGFLGMFRSRSGNGTSRAPHQQPPPTSQAEQEKANLQLEFSEKAAQLQVGAQNPVVATQAEGSSSSHPLSSIANVFRGKPSTPISSPPPNEKAAYMDAAKMSPAHRDESPSKRKGKEVDRATASGEAAEGEERAPAEVAFDFNKFIGQMRVRQAEPVVKYFNSFLREFSRKPPPSPAAQAKVINDFLDFIAAKMRAVDPWKSILAGFDREQGEAEFEMSLEAMEKLVMNRLWHLTFSPALDLHAHPGQMSSSGDIERDQILSQRIRLFAWVEPKHLDLPVPNFKAGEKETAVLTPTGSSPASSPKLEQGSFAAPSSGEAATSPAANGLAPALAIASDDPAVKAARRKERQIRTHMDNARQELLKMNQYKSPRDKLICILNACKIIFALMRFTGQDEGADAFIPFLIYIVLKANPEHLVSNIQYIQRFRNPDQLTGEGGYYLSSLGGAISFIESLDASSLSHITQEEFEHNVAEAIASLPVDPNDSSVRLPKTPTPTRATFSLNGVPAAPAGTEPPTAALGGADEESPALLNQPGAPPGQQSLSALFAKGTDSIERAVSKPIGAIGALFEQLEGAISGEVTPTERDRQQQAQLRPSAGARRRSQLPERRAQVDPGLFASEGMTNRQISEEINRQHEQQRVAAIETLASIFPAAEREVLEMVLLANSEDMAKTIDALLEMQ